jgi:hypothetical protein
LAILGEARERLRCRLENTFKPDARVMGLQDVDRT